MSPRPLRHRSAPPPLLLVLLLLIAGGCASGTDTTLGMIVPDSLDDVPDDFSLDVITRRGRLVPVTADVQGRAGRLVVMPDGSLHARIEESDRPAPRMRSRPLDDLPPRVRILDRRSLAAVWSNLNQLGFADPDAGTPPFDVMSVDVPDDEIRYLIAVGANGRRWSFVRPPVDGAPDPASVELVRLLAGLAWAADELAPNVRVAPRRYDLGPDPYAPYRARE